jgi:hypothetical protein
MEARLIPIETKVTAKGHITERLDQSQQEILCKAAQNDGVWERSFDPDSYKPSSLGEVPEAVKQLEASHLLEQLPSYVYKKTYLLTLDGWHLALQYGQQNSTSTGLLTRLRSKLRQNIERSWIQFP